MTQDEVFALVLQKLDAAPFNYMVCGSVAAILYGEPRMTNDMDLVVAVLPQRAREFSTLFPADQFYCPPIEVLEREFTVRGQFNLLHLETGIRIDCIVMKDDEFAREEFRRRQRVPFTETQQADVACPEDVILGKLRFFKMGGSEKHLADIRGMVNISGDQIDFNYLRHWVNELNLEAEWQKAQST